MEWPKNLDPNRYPKEKHPNGWDQAKEGTALAKKYNIQPTDVLTSCSTCHR
jgi:hypothetical protein